MSGATCVVTGGAGFVGASLTTYLLDLGYKVHVVDNLSLGLRELVDQRAKFWNLDIRDFDSSRALFRRIQPEIIFHLAALATTKETSAGWLSPDEMFDVNTKGTRIICKSIVEADIDPVVVLTSSAAVYGEPISLPIKENDPMNPISPYGISKLCAEKILYAYHVEYGLKTIIARLFNVYGPSARRYLIFDVYHKLKENCRYLEILGSGNQIRDFVHIYDVVDVLERLSGAKNAIENIFNVGTGKGMTVKEVVKIVIQTMNLNNVDLRYSMFSWKGDPSKLIADIKKLSRFLSWTPKFPPHEGISNVILKLESSGLSSSLKRGTCSTGGVDVV